MKHAHLGGLAAAAVLGVRRHRHNLADGCGRLDGHDVVRVLLKLARVVLLPVLLAAALPGLSRLSRRTELVNDANKSLQRLGDLRSMPRV